ncbi:TraB/GumN family protein [Ruegeria arenilitoris]|uniref:TraB/GumN family protein n=1 Tax=Ruegeria arenilitoris TaxID=1173585 RepID=UPI001480CF6D|nr:TraB/GumN family protein [Ruegeria arenilitoris]
MRVFLFALLAALHPIVAHAACDGRDLRQDMTPEARAELNAATSQMAYPEGNHWIAQKDNTVLHLIGTLHVNDPRMGPVVERLAPTLSEADAFYFEITQSDMSAFEQDLAKDFSPVLINSGPTLIDLMSEEDWAVISKALSARGIPGWMAAKLRPWFLSMMLGMPPCMLQVPDADRGMDARLTELAEAAGKPQYSLEQIEDLIAIFDSHTLEEQVQSLVRLVDALDAGDDHMVTMASAYFEEKHAEILQFAKIYGRDASGLAPDVFAQEWAAFEDQLLVQRNDNWMETILIIENQTAVIAVGAGHLGGDHGLLQQLERAGYQLSRAQF